MKGSLKRIAVTTSVLIAIFLIGLSLYTAWRIYLEANEEYSIPITKLSSKIPQKVENISTGDILCGGARGDEKVSMFRNSDVVLRDAEEIYRYSNGSSSRRSVALDVIVEADERGFPGYLRVLHVLSTGVPNNLIGKRLIIKYGICIRYSAVGETGTIIGTLLNEGSDHPVISPY